ncbi:regulatory protein RecX [Anaerococcus lactolyticus ATCC 51172]|uniref:Regulatory protein RecX n=1 Tax=Anaerococcus lactolyticus ATCC 51172 TaxID=525254 RepID=C2BCG4_9FIRM|nr:RecX family transcriptional regulator [Anaerococcus lactolyticus]EEI87366.1 regulatory protein RecX [Anaerococcus lactolyticus ATCC 51172]
MIIENIEYSDKYNLIRLTISKERFYVDYDLYYENGFELEKEIDFPIYKKILANDEFNRAKNFALNKISFSQKSTYEIRQKLKDQKFSADVIEKIISYLDSYGFLDDEAYVKAYIRDKDEISSWSRGKIKYMLRQKHIDENLIEDNLCLISDEREAEKAGFFADKKVKNDYSYENRAKVFRHLAGKGFDIDIINQVLNERFS